MSFLGFRNAVSIGVSQHVTMGGPNLLNKLSPSLLLNFAGAQTLDPRITFTRASTATFTGSNGLIQTAAIDAPRFDYNPTTLAPLGLLIEEQRTNLLTYSEQFDNAAWTKTRSSITADATTSPDGTQDADKLVEDTATNTHDMTVSASFTSGTAYTLSIYAKQAGRNLRIYFPSGAFGSAFSAVFDLSAGTATIALTGTVASITNVGNGWYRCSITQTATASVTSIFTLRLIEGASTTSYTGDGTSGIYIWGAQLEAGAFPTSYIPTEASQVTRSADLASMTGTNFSSWFNATEGTFFNNVFLRNAPATNLGSIYAVSNGTSAERILVSMGTGAGGNINAVVTDNSVLQAQTINGSLSAAGKYKYANAYQLNDFASVANGGSAAADTSGTLPTVDRLFFGANAVGNTGFLNGTISQIAYYPRRLANSELQAITA
jgi:hypothetical protein